MQTRHWFRIIHLLGAACLGTFVYSPWSTNEAFQLLNQVIVVPALSVTGLWMWLGHRLRAKRRKGKPVSTA